MLVLAAAAYDAAAVSELLGSAMGLDWATGVQVPEHVIPLGGLADGYSRFPVTLAPPPKEIWPLEPMSPVSVKF